MQWAILLACVASMFLLVLSKSAETLNEAVAMDTASNVVSLTADAGSEASAHRYVWSRDRSTLSLKRLKCPFLQCQSVGITPFTGLPLAAVTSLFVQADANKDAVLSNFEVLYFGNVMQIYLQCANPYGEFDA